jgi:hypothetical protein
LTVVVALKSEENESLQTQTSHITLLSLDDERVLMEETEIPGGVKYEGVLFL